jgi:hypothetical protein
VIRHQVLVDYARASNVDPDRPKETARFNAATHYAGEDRLCGLRIGRLARFCVMLADFDVRRRRATCEQETDGNYGNASHDQS